MPRSGAQDGTLFMTARNPGIANDSFAAATDRIFCECRRFVQAGVAAIGDLPQPQTRLHSSAFCMVLRDPKSRGRTARVQ
jgi:hypothetical protein